MANEIKTRVPQSNSLNSISNSLLAASGIKRDFVQYQYSVENGHVNTDIEIAAKKYLDQNKSKKFVIVCPTTTVPLPRRQSLRKRNRIFFKFKSGFIHCHAMIF
jgi:hypothetical protein